MKRMIQPVVPIRNAIRMAVVRIRFLIGTTVGCTCIIITVILKFMVQHGDDQAWEETQGFQFWYLGLAFLLPGILGIVAAATRHEAAYGVYMGFSILALVATCIMAIVMVIAITAIAMMDVDCKVTDGLCYCGIEGGDRTQLPNVDDCALINKSAGLFIAAMAFFVISWVVCFVGTILSCAACCCCGEPRIPHTVILCQSPDGILETHVRNVHMQPVAGADFSAVAVSTPPPYSDKVCLVSTY